MQKKYCILDNTNKFIGICEEHEYQSHAHKHIIIHTEPPYIDDNKVAYWENNKWKILRANKVNELEVKNKNDFLDNLRKKLEINDISNKVNEKYKDIPSFESSLMYSNKLLLGRLKEENEALSKKMIYLFENNKRITKKIKIYKQDLEKKIKELEDSREFYSELPIVPGGERSKIDLAILVPSKVPF